MIYQINLGFRRLLWMGRRRTQAALRRDLAALGREVVGWLQFVCGDICRLCLAVIATQAGQDLQVLDRFHITGLLNQALDRARRGESGRLCVRQGR